MCNERWSISVDGRKRFQQIAHHVHLAAFNRVLITWHPRVTMLLGDVLMMRPVVLQFVPDDRVVEQVERVGVELTL